MSKFVAETLKNLATSDTMQVLLDRSKDPLSELGLSLERALLDHWSYDLYTRRPGPALLENGVLTPTDLDLACFMSALARRHAVINLPRYQSRRPKTVREGERVVSAANRHGRILGLTANKEVFSFSVRVEDMNVLQQGSTSGTEAEPEDKVGAPRNFMLVDLDGTWHDGWSKIEFMPSAKENAFLNDKRLWTGNTVIFQNFVHPNRWISFYGQYYFLTKALIQRLEDEAVHHRAEQKRLTTAGIFFPSEGEGARKDWPKTTTAPEDVATEKVQAFEAEVDVPWTGAFHPLREAQTALVASAAFVKQVQYHTLPALRFAVRATELAFFKRFFPFITAPGFPAWIKGAAWEPGYVQKGKRTKWNRLVLTQTWPGQVGFAIRYRVYEKTERVAP